jgi:hypothetical protein
MTQKPGSGDRSIALPSGLAKNVTPQSKHSAARPAHRSVPLHCGHGMGATGEAIAHEHTTIASK